MANVRLLSRTADNSAMREVLEAAAARVGSDERPVAGVAVVVVYKDGAASTAYEGADHMGMVGALEWCKRRVLDEWCEQP